MIDHSYYPSCTYCSHCVRDGHWLRHCSKFDTELPFGQGLTLCTEYDYQKGNKSWKYVFDAVSQFGTLYNWEPYGHKPQPFFLLKKRRFVDVYDQKVYEDLIIRLKEAGHI